MEGAVPWWVNDYSDEVVMVLKSASSKAAGPEGAHLRSLVPVHHPPPLGGTGDEVFWLVATDPDHSSLTYSINGNNSQFFSVNASTGQVKLKVPLDYETQPFFPINIFVSNSNEMNCFSHTPFRGSPGLSHLQISRTMTVIIEDRNDNPPIFSNTVLSISINETLPPGSVVYNATATDPDTGSGGVVNYYIDGFIPNNAETKELFTIEKNGSIILKGNLSYNNKSSSYQLKLGACDSGGEYKGEKNYTQCSTPFYLSITVIDEADLDPQFLKEFYSASVAEDAIQGTSVLRVEAQDGDKGLNWKLVYSITNSTKPGWFRIDPSSGVIEVDGSLDREELLEENEEVRVLVTATEENENIFGQKASISTWVTVRVTDINDHDPEFFNCSLPDCSFEPQLKQHNFSGSVDEHASTRIPIDNLTMVVYDPDKGNNGTFLLSLEGPDAAAFSVSPERAAGSTEVQVLVKNPSLVDYEVKIKMEVQVMATDTASGNTTKAWVTIHLRDINDHRPTFPESLYNCTVKEHCKDDVVCQNITAYDKDEQSVINYTLLPGSGADVFEVNSTSGKITAKNCTLLDREAQAVYYLTLEAKDNGGLSNTTNVQVFLEDINDNPPKIIGSYNIFVKEGENSTVSECIKATDDDQPGTNNSLLKFSLENSTYSQNFSINATGCLSNLKPLDREAISPGLNGRIVLKVNVSDCGDPVLSTVANVTITVEDVNDNVPVFSNSNYKFSVNERVSNVQVGEITASDADQTTANNRISFSLSGNGSQNFIIKGVPALKDGMAEGLLWLPPDVSLDYESQSLYNFSVMAENPDPGSSSATANVLVWVQDVNDEPPVLVAESLQGVIVAENGSQHGEVATVKAVDPDSTAQVVIQLVNVFCTKDGKDVGSLCSTWFDVQPNGTVVINQSEAIDYETCNQVTLVVRAYDEKTDGNFLAFSNNGSLIITIQDVNDNAPQFLQNNKTFVIIPELVIPNQQVASVQATDKDSGKNGIIHFSIKKVEFVPKEGSTITFNGFRVTTSSEANVFTGSIELVTSLDSKLQGTYEVTVQAQDTPSVGSPLQTETTLNLFTVDQSYRITLEFSTSQSEVGDNVEEIKEALGQATRTSVYIVSIRDKDNSVRAQGRTFLDAYFVFSNGTALKLDQLSTMIRGDQDSLMKLLQLGLVVLGSEDTQNSDVTQRLSGVIIGLGIALVLLIIIMITSLVCVRRSYKRELRAVKAAKEARQTVAGVNTSSSAIPGTNLYNTDRANPMLNLATKDLGFESQSSCSDMDRTSLNSLDENSVDLGKEKEKPERKKQSKQNQKKADKVPLDSQVEDDEGLLSMVLSDRKKSAGGQQKVAFSNPVLNISDDSKV
ncbi:cadherin-related family member 2 [Suncus etruscus]|uniref:cadherin-related family member 2 n=1 Tax=Suncus etruscus TaxID=109475 RepID=UPI002110A392|nr:cadherin-related family member 2 [Suncus etruscus]